MWTSFGRWSLCDIRQSGEKTMGTRQVDHAERHTARYSKSLLKGQFDGSLLPKINFLINSYHSLIRVWINY